MRGLGDNGGPRWEEDRPRTLSSSNKCALCANWRPPCPRLVVEYRAYEAGVTKRPVAQPRGACDQKMMRPDGPTAFCATTENGNCYNFTPKPRA